MMTSRGTFAVQCALSQCLAIISIAHVHYLTFFSQRSNAVLSFWFVLSSLFARICLDSLWAIDILAACTAPHRTRRNWHFYTNIFTIKYKLLRPSFVGVRSTAVNYALQMIFFLFIVIVWITDIRYERFTMFLNLLRLLLYKEFTSSMPGMS